MNLGADPSRDVVHIRDVLWNFLLDWQSSGDTFSLNLFGYTDPTAGHPHFTCFWQITAKQPWTKKKKKGPKGLKTKMIVPPPPFFFKRRLFSISPKPENGRFRRRCPGRRWVRWPSQIRLQRSRWQIWVSQRVAGWLWVICFYHKSPMAGFFFQGRKNFFKQLGGFF